MDGKLLVVDLDDTLIQTSEYKDKIFEKLVEVSGIDMSQINTIYQDIKNADQPEKWHILLPQKLSQICKVGEQKLQEVILNEVPNIKIKQKVLDFVKKFTGKKIIFSFGDEKFQKLKIKTLNLGGYFDQIIITNQPKIKQLSSLVEGYSDVWVIDNNQEFITQINSKFPRIKTVTTNLPGELTRQNLV